MNDKKQQTTKNPKKNPKEIKGLNIDKAEYQEIVLSNSNFPDRDYFKRGYYD